MNRSIELFSNEIYLKNKRDSNARRKREQARLKLKEPVYEMTPQRVYDLKRVYLEIEDESIKLNILKQLEK